MTVGQLRNRVAAYERELNWAPPYVADQLAATHHELRRHQTDATVWAARAQAADPAEREQLTAAVADARRAAETLSEQVEQLELADEIRGAWFAETAVTREYATRARAGLEVRGVDPESPDDRVTAEEWLATERAEQAESDPHREVRADADLHDPDHDEDVHTCASAPVHDEPGVLETAVPDIREISEPDESEHVDPVERQRVPRVDETARMVERAESALAEIGAREVHDTEAEAHAATQEPEESARAVELNRWAEDDLATEQARTDFDELADAQ